MRTPLYLFFLFLFATTTIKAQVKANFSATVVSGCSPLQVQFNDLSTGSPSQWYWDFGDGQSSTQKNPVTTYNSGGTFTVKLFVKNSTSQDFNEKPAYIKVSSSPVISFLQSADSGCAPLDVNFTNTTDLFGEKISEWVWDFGDGSISNLQNPTHVYGTGIFSVLLRATNTSGCSSSLLKKDNVRAGVKPTAKFSGDPLDGCGSVVRNFKDESSGNITGWNWDFGEGGIRTEQNPKYHFQDTGWFNVKLKVSSNGCIDSFQRDNYMHIIGPIAIINETRDCADPYTVTLKNKSIGDRSWSWKFGDGDTTTIKNPVHTYKKPGIYIVELSVKGLTCSDKTTDSVFVIIQNPQIQLTPSKSSYCRGDSILLKVVNYDSTTAKSCSWRFGDGDSTGFGAYIFSISHVYYQPGNYRVALYFKDKSNCVDTARTTIVVNGPTARFSASSPACVNTPVSFDDNTNLNGGPPIKSYFWNYGDGNFSTITAPPSTNTYVFPGDYAVTMQVEDTNGCKDTVAKNVKVFDIPKTNAGKDTLLCQGKSVRLVASGATTFTWNADASLSCTNCNNPLANPKVTTNYVVTGYNQAGCSTNDTVTVTVIPKQSLSAQPSSYTICDGETIQFNVTGMEIYSWQPITGLSNASIPDPVATPANNITYTVTGTDNGGCFTDKIDIPVTVNPSPTVDITVPSTIIVPGTSYQITSTASSDVISYNWVPSKDLTCNDCPEPVASPASDVTYFLTALNSFGCSSKDSISIFLVCDKENVFVPNTFSPNKDGINDEFYPRSNVSVTIKSFRVFNRWGQKVYEKKDFQANNARAGWDGRFQGVLQPPDVYIYVMEITCANGQTFVHRGDVSIIR